MRNNYFLLIGLFFSSFFISKVNSQTYILSVEEFESSGSDIDSTWSESGLSTDGIWSVGSNLEASSQYWTVPEHTQFAYTNDDACNCDKSSDRLILPEQDFSNFSESPVLIFDAFNDGLYGGLSYIEVSIDGGVNFNIIDTISTNLSQWQNNLQYDLDFAGESSVTIAITYNDNGEWASGLAIDNVSIIERPSCFSPSLSYLTRTDSSVTLEWTSDTLATAFIIEIGLQGFNPENEGNSIFLASNNNVYTFNDLTENSFYDIYIRSVCDYPDESLRSGPYTFRTFCNTITSSWSESWDNEDNCLWNFYDLNTDNYSWSTYNPFTGISGTEQIINNYNPPSSDDYLMSPAFSCIDGVTDRLMFDSKNVFHSYGEPYYDTLLIGIYDDSIANFLGFVGEIVPDTNYTTYEYDLSDYVGQDIRFFIYSGVSSGVDLNGVSFVDNVVVDAWPPCPTPIDLVATTGITSADISWTVRGDETEWNVEYGETGYTQGTGSVFSSSSNSTTITGLNLGSTYDFYVQANCGGADGTSEWVGPATFFMPSCVTPTNLELVDIDSTSAVVSWSAGYLEDTWQVEYGEVGFLPDSGTTSIVDANTFNAVDLISGVTYELYVQAYCGDVEGYSDWIGPIEFTTELTCTIDAPFIENFSGDVPNCWIQETISDSLDWVINSGGTLSPGTGPSDDYGDDGNYMYVEMTGSSYPSNAVMYTESYDLSNLLVPELKFYAHMTGLSTGTLKINMVDGNNSIEIFSVSGDQGDNWMEYTIDLNPTSSIINFEIIAENDTAYFTTPAGDGPHTWMGDIAIDEFGIDEKQSCYSPYNVTQIDLTSSTVSFEWNTNPSITNWNYVVVGQGQDPSSTAEQSISTDSIIITGLTEATNYDFYIQSDCDSSMQGPFSFSTIYPQDYGCLHTLKMYDSYGDGWNGGSIDIRVNDILVVNLGSIDNSGSTIGNEGSIEFGAQQGDDIQISNFVPGDYPEEISFEILDGGDNIIFESGILNGDTSINSTVNGVCPENDLKVINSVVSSGCDLTNEELVEIWVTNVGIVSETDFSLTFSVNGIVESEIFNDTLNPNDTLKYVFTNTVDMSVVGEYEFIMTCNLTSDIYNDNDSAYAVGISTQSPNPPETFDYIFCAGDTAQLSVTPSSSFTIWYDSITGGNIKGYGNVLTFTDSSSIAYYAESRAAINIVSDDFESYSSGDSIAQSSENWETWSSGINFDINEDAQVSNSISADGANSLVLSEGDDIVLPLSENAIDNGLISFEMDMNVDSIGYFSFQTDPIPGVGWAFEVVFINDTVSVVEGSTNTGLLGKYPGPGVWFNISLALDIDNGLGQLFINNESQGFFQFNSSLGGVNFYAPVNVGYAIDNLTSSFVTNCVSERSESYVTVGIPTTQKDSIVTCETVFTWIDGNNYYQSNDSATFTYQSFLGCDSVIELDLTIITERPELSSSVTNLSCYQSNDGSASVSVTGGTEPYTFSWSNGSLAQNIENLSSGNYEVSLSDENGCLVTQSINISEPEEILVNVSISAPSGCDTDDGTATASVSGGYLPYTYVWNNGLTATSIDNLSSGLYTVTVTDSNGCLGTASNSVNSTEAPELIVDSITTVSCFGASDGAINLSVVGGIEPYLYNWDNGEENLNINGISSGTYVLTVTDSNDCIVSESVEITEPNEIIIEYLLTNPSGCGNEDDGEITANVIGGLSPYDYNWENSADSSSTISDLSQGIYNLTVTTAEGCSKSSFVSLSSSDAPNLNFDIENETCFGYNNGSISAIVSGGVTPYLYEWDNGSETPSINDLSNGDYFLTVTDANNCQVSQIVSLFSPDEMEISFYVSDLVCDGESNGMIWGGVVSGGVAPYNYNWSNGSNTSNLDNLSAGNYNLVISDLTNCFIDTTFFIDTANIPLTTQINGDTITGFLSTDSYYVAGDTNSNYYWMVENGEITSNQGDNLVTVQWDTISNGQVSVIETNINGCTGDTVYFNVEVVNSTGIKSPIHNYIINAYPNPSNADFKIATSGYKGDIRFEVFDLSGRLITKGIQRIVSIGNCPDGIYLLKVYTNNKSNELRLIKTSK